MANELGFNPAQLLLGWHGSGRTLTVLKINNMNNTAYIDTFFSYICSEITEKNILGVNLVGTVSRLESYL
mgnify:CR=1 FL=1